VIGVFDGFGPTLVLVHGAFHREAMWDLLIRELSDVDIRTVQLPSSAQVPVSQLGDLYDGARTVRGAVLGVGGPVVVCAHSYGGVPTTEGVAGVNAVTRRST
jgi:pimeloyl-ACP methyl ester carboxylesterase